MKVASIGVAGERGVKYACVVNDLHRAAGRSGVGAVMGSKNLKAIGVRGTKGVTVDNVPAFKAAADAGKQRLADNTDRKELTELGTNAMIDVMQQVGGLPTATSGMCSSKASVISTRAHNSNAHRMAIVTT